VTGCSVRPLVRDSLWSASVKFNRSRAKELGVRQGGVGCSQLTAILQSTLISLLSPDQRVWKVPSASVR
jgi:hypothetical protein